MTKASYFSPNAADKFFVSKSQFLRAKGAFNLVKGIIFLSKLVLAGYRYFYLTILLR